MSWAGSHATRLRRLCIETYGLTCWLCGQPCEPNAVDRARRPSADHVIPRAHGGTDALSNLRTAHVGCNSSRGARPESKATESCDNKAAFF